MRRFAIYALALILGTVVGLWASDGAVWHAIAGPPDLGAATFDRQERPANEFVVCTKGDGDCVAPDETVDAVPGDPAAVIDRLDAYAVSQPRTVRVDDGSDPLHRRYVVRSALLKFPDTVSVNASPIAADGAPATSLSISSRSQIGQSDLGVNGERVRDWLAALR